MQISVLSCLSVLSCGLLAAEPAREVVGLSREQAQAAIREESESRANEIRKRGEIHEVSIGTETMPWKETTFGKEVDGKKSLWISMHGGGSAPKDVNDQQWDNQARLYKLNEGVYVAPRAPTDDWDMWHKEPIDGFFDQLISYMVATHGVDPNRVYVLGYSAGGDGAWRLGPRMADRWAAAAMMAGHPGYRALENLRHTPSAFFCGGNDAAYKRNEENAKSIEIIKDLARANPGDYQNFSKIIPDSGHWMSGKDAEALPWMSQFSRTPWPKTLTWKQGEKVRSRFFWLEVPSEKMKTGETISATIEGQTISVTGDVPMSLNVYLSDELLNLDQPVTLLINGAKHFQGKAPRNRDVIQQFLTKRLDAPACPTALIMVAWSPGKVLSSQQ